MAKHEADTLKTYLMVFAALMVLLVVTVWVAFHHFGVFNPIIAVGIALLKATLVILFFMHVRQSSSLTKVFAGAGFVFMVVMIFFIMSDVLSRNMMDLTEMQALPGPFEMLMQEDTPADAPAAPGDAIGVPAPK